MPAQNKKTVSGRGLLSNSLRSLGLDSQARPRTRSYAKSNFLGQLPPEILLRILRDSGLDSEDVKNVRLVCRQFSYGLTAQLLFHTAHLSRFRCDLDSFLGIASQPRIACEVRVLVWHEVFQTGDGRYENLSDEEIPLAKEIENTLERIDWLGGASLHNPADQERKRICKIKDLLRQGVRAMTKLHTLVSKPIHPRRRLTLPGDRINYPLTAQSLALDRSSRNASVCRFWDLDTATQIPKYYPLSSPNWGFCNFLVWVAAKAAELGLPIRSLCFADEQHWRYALSRLQVQTHGRDCLEALKKLASIDLCLSFGYDADLLRLAKCLRQSSVLTSLSLCFENGCTYEHQELLLEGQRNNATSRGRLMRTPTRASLSHKCRLLHEDCAEKKRGLGSCSVQMLNLFLVEHPVEDPAWKPLAEQQRWEGLRELRLTHCIFRMRTLSAFMARHAHCLRKLHLVECDITVRDILTIAKQDLEVTDTLDLREFKIVQSTAGDKGLIWFWPERHLAHLAANQTPAERAGFAEAAVQPYWVDEDRLLSLINASFRSRVGKPREAKRTSRYTKLCTKPQEKEDIEFINLLSSLGGLDRHFAQQLYTVGRGKTACTHHAIFDSDSEHCHSYAIEDVRVECTRAEELYGKDEVAALDDEMGRGDHTVRSSTRGHPYHSSTLFSPQEHNDPRYLEIMDGKVDEDMQGNSPGHSRDQKAADDDGGDEDKAIEWFDYFRRSDLDDDDDDKDDGFWWVAACDSMGVLYLWKEVEYRRKETTLEQNIREHREFQAAIEAQWKSEEEDMDEAQEVKERRRFIMTTFKNRRWNTRTRQYRTECWKFVRRHPNTDKEDEIAYGREPLEYWADWGKDVNDEATPTPQGFTLWLFLNSHTLLHDPSAERTEPGSAVCSDEEIKAHGGERFAAYGDARYPDIEPAHRLPEEWRHDAADILGVCVTTPGNVVVAGPVSVGAADDDPSPAPAVDDDDRAPPPPTIEVTTTVCVWVTVCRTDCVKDTGTDTGIVTENVKVSLTQFVLDTSTVLVEVAVSHTVEVEDSSHTPSHMPWRK
ncbi:hypothetical protein V8F33_005858 [Rhypophila sp. PSN 637]